MKAAALASSGEMQQCPALHCALHFKTYLVGALCIRTPAAKALRKVGSVWGREFGFPVSRQTSWMCYQ